MKINYKKLGKAYSNLLHNKDCYFIQTNDGEFFLDIALESFTDLGYQIQLSLQMAPSTRVLGQFLRLCALRCLTSRRLRLESPISPCSTASWLREVESLQF